MEPSTLDHPIPQSAQTHTHHQAPPAPPNIPIRATSRPLPQVTPKHFLFLVHSSDSESMGTLATPSRRSSKYSQGSGIWMLEFSLLCLCWHEEIGVQVGIRLTPLVVQTRTRDFHDRYALSKLQLASAKTHII